MPFVKVVKNATYYKRFQVKFRRRRECKTDYKARRFLITQDKTKYNSPKYRLVVRFSNKDVTCQIVKATLKSDVVLAAAYSHELSNYGAKVYKGCGMKNYAASYATGLLLARRILTILGLNEQYAGQTKPDGKDFLVKRTGEDRRPFKVLLDIGLHYTTTGARLFGAMKGAVDGGLAVPHNHKRFVGYNPDTGKFDAAKLRKSIFGGPVADYMRILEEKDQAKYQKQFSRYIAAGVNADGVEAMWVAVHANIRKNPVHVKAVRTTQPKRVCINRKKLSLKQKRNNTQARINNATRM